MEQKIVWNYYDDSPQYLLRLGMNQNKEIIIQCLKMKKFDNEILEITIPKDKKMERILECNDKNQVFFVDLNTYDIRYNQEKNEYELRFIKNGKETFGPKILNKNIKEIAQEFKKEYIKKYKDYIKSLKIDNNNLQKELKSIINDNKKIEKINEKISKKLKEVEELQNESLNNPINNNL